MTRNYYASEGDSCNRQTIHIYARQAERDASDYAHVTAAEARHALTSDFDGDNGNTVHVHGDRQRNLPAWVRAADADCN